MTTSMTETDTSVCRSEKDAAKFLSFLCQNQGYCDALHTTLGDFIGLGPEDFITKIMMLEGIPEPVMHEHFTRLVKQARYFGIHGTIGGGE